MLAMLKIGSSKWPIQKNATNFSIAEIPSLKARVPQDNDGELVVSPALITSGVQSALVDKVDGKGGPLSTDAYIVSNDAASCPAASADTGILLIVPTGGARGTPPHLP